MGCGNGFSEDKIAIRILKEDSLSALACCLHQRTPCPLHVLITQKRWMLMLAQGHLQACKREEQDKMVVFWAQHAGCILTVSSCYA